MDKKRKGDVSTPTPETGGEQKKKLRRIKADEGDASSKEPEDTKTQLEKCTGKEEGYPETNVKVKMGLGAKRTKKPPKSLENFICRPPIRVSQKPGPAFVDGTKTKSKNSNQVHHSSQKKCRSDSPAPESGPSTTKTNENPSTSSPSSLTPDKSSLPASDSPNITAGKKVPPKQAKKKSEDLNCKSRIQEPPKAAQPQLSKLPISHKKSTQTLVTPIKKTSSHRSASSSPRSSQEDSSSQEGTKAENLIQQAQDSLNCRNGSPSEIKERSCKRNSVPSKQVSCLPKNDAKHIDEKKGDDSRSPNNDSIITSGEKNMHHNGSSQPSSPCANDQPENIPSVQVVGSSSPGKHTDSIPDCGESGQESNGQNEHEDLNKTLEMTMKSSQAFPVFDKQIDTKGSCQDEQGKTIKDFLNQDQLESNCSFEVDPEILPTPAKNSTTGSSLNTKEARKQSKKRKLRHLCSEKIAKISSKNNHSPVPCATVQQERLQSDGDKLLTPVQCEQKTVEPPVKSNKSKNATATSEISSSNNPQAKKRGRPKTNKLKVPLQGNNLQTSSPSSKSSSNQNPGTVLDLDVKKPESSMAKKRGRPKRFFSAQSQSTLATVPSKKQDTGDNQVRSEDKRRDSQQMPSRSNRVRMKTIIRRINKMKVKRRDQVLTQVLLGKKQCDGTEFPQESIGAELSSPVAPDTHSLSSLVTSFGGKLGPQINVSKRGTIYMGKRRGRKPKYEKNSSSDSKQIPSPYSHQDVNSSSSALHQSMDSRTGSSSLKTKTSSSSSGRSSQLNTQKVKANSFRQLSELQNSKTCFESLLPSSTGVGVNDNGTLERSERETNVRLTSSFGFPSTLATGSVFTMSGVQGSGSLKGKSRGLSTFTSEHLPSARLPLDSGRTPDSNGTRIASPPLPLTNQEVHKFKCHRRGHHCIGPDKLKRHKYKCKKKYMQLRAKRQDPDFLAAVEDLVVRLRDIHIVHHITRARLDDDGCTPGRKSGKSKSQSHDIQCLQEDVHPPTMFQINFSGYYSPHSTLSCDPLHYVRMTNMKRKHGCSSEPSEPVVTHYPVMHKLGYPVSGGGFFHPSYKVPFTTTSLGFGLYRGYPSTAQLYPSSFPSSYVHHYSKNPIISPSKFHKKKTKVAKKDSDGLWGGKSHGIYPRMTPNFSCDCFNRQCWQREKQREKSREGREEHCRMREREQDTEWHHWQQKLSKDKNSMDCSSNSPSSFSLFSHMTHKDKDKTFPSNLRQMGEVRWSEHQPPWRCMRGFESKFGNRGLSQELSSKDQEDSVEGQESDGDLALAQHSSKRTHSFLKQPTLFSKTRSQRKMRKGTGVTSASAVLTEQDGMSMPGSSGDKRTGYGQTGSLHFSEKHPSSLSPSARDPENPQREQRGHKGSRRTLIQDEEDETCDQTSHRLIQEHVESHFKHHRDTARSKLTQHPNPSRTKNPPGLEDTAGHEVKKRGRGRPRKNPPPSPCQMASSPLSLSPAPPPHPSLAEEMERSVKGSSTKRQTDTVLEVIESVIRGEQKKRGRKGRNTGRDEDKGLQTQGDEVREGTETFSDLHMFSALSPEHAAALDTDSDIDDQSEKNSALSPNKKYLWAGLYSDVYKSEDVPELQELSTDCFDYNPEEHEHGLFPAPLHVGKYLRLKRIDFQLPFDIHWLCAHNKLFENPDIQSSTIPQNSSCETPTENVHQHSTNDCPHTRLTDRSNQADVPQLHEETDEHHLPLEEEEEEEEEEQEEHHDHENFPSPLSSEERSFVMKHGVFLVRNYEKMRARQAELLLREGEREQEIGEEEEEERSSRPSEDGGNGENASVQPDRCLNEQKSGSPEEEEQTEGVQSRNLADTLQKIWDSIVTCKGSSGQTLTAPLLNLCSRKRSDPSLLDLSVVQKQLSSGHYTSLEEFHADMLSVFHCAEKYYGCESSVGRDVSQLRIIYNQAHQDASAHASSVL